MAKIITIAQQKGGAGKSTLAAHLAVSLMQKKFKVGIIDTDPQASLSTWYSLREEVFGTDYTGLDFSKASGIRVANEIAHLKNKCDIVIIDSPPHTAMEAKSSIRAADLVLIPMQPSPTDLWASKATIEFCKQEQKNHYVLLNRFNSKNKISQEIASQIENKLDASLANRVSYAAAIFKGKTVIETEPKSAAALEIRNLTDEISAILSDEDTIALKTIA